MAADLKWWQRGVLYQIYPRSFQDTNKDGIGDLPGIIERLDHLVDLGVDAAWISPIYPSPMADFGYDVSDYCGVAPLFGTLGDCDRLIAAAHARNLKIILDYVPNHTSDQHPWFLQSRRSRKNPYRDWYIWHDPAPHGGPPNNWLSNFGGSAWGLDEATGQYYYHSFLKEQPDLNWRNAATRHAMLHVLNFWLDRGVDGFRVDVLWMLIKDDQFRDNPPNPGYVPGNPSHHRLLSVYTANRPEVHEIVAEMRAVLDAYRNRVLIGEIYLPINQLVTYYGADLNGAQLPFNFQLIESAWSAEGIAEIIQKYEAALPPGAWPNWVLGNHDKSRLASRIGEAQARVAAMMLLTLRGTPTIYYGEEIGMLDVSIPPDEIQDPAEKNEPGLGLGRDPERTPIPWDGSLYAGFSRVKPWLPIGLDHLARNVSAQHTDPSSLLNLYRQLLALRRKTPALISGGISNVSATGHVLTYQRTLGADKFTISLNLGRDAQQIPHAAGTIIRSTHFDHSGHAIANNLVLRPAEGVISKLT
ncbi:MAG TPA: alpha-amylase family glycosyl hydrolase [Candidatus Acidoferrales bacterium]|jgi:alpha-glucosidase|nr:alpha-amylase family glycosyl hydrolase [Candidatus Acidoferrales bacterium]